MDCRLLTITVVSNGMVFRATTSEWQNAYSDGFDLSVAVGAAEQNA